MTLTKAQRVKIAKKAGEIAGEASTACAGKKGDAFHTCRTRYFKAQRAKAEKKLKK